MQQYDVFISHASEDKDAVARPLAERLRTLGVKVWIDEGELTLGDSLNQKIEHGLSQSRFGVVVLSHDFFRKHWPRRELNGLAAKEEGGRKVIIPIWHNVEREDIVRYAPSLADKLAASTKDGIDPVARQVLLVLRGTGPVEELATHTARLGSESRARGSRSKLLLSGALAGLVLVGGMALWAFRPVERKYETPNGSVSAKDTPVVGRRDDTDASASSPGQAGPAATPRSVQEIKEQSQPEAAGLTFRRQPKNDVTKLEVESATSQVMGDSASVVIYTFGYGAIASEKVEVHVNGRDVSQRLTQQGDFENGSVLTVMGSMKQLNLNIGDNQVFLKIGDFVTKPRIFKSFKVF